MAATNKLTIDAWDPISGTEEFKACAVRIERVAVDSLPSGSAEAAEQYALKASSSGDERA